MLESVLSDGVPQRFCVAMRVSSCMVGWGRSHEVVLMAVCTCGWDLSRGGAETLLERRIPSHLK